MRDITIEGDCPGSALLGPNLSERKDVVWNNGMCLEKMLTDQMSCVAWQPPAVPRVAGHVHLCGDLKFVFSFLFLIDWAQNVER